jgi:hypothetical protein
MRRVLTQVAHAAVQSKGSMFEIAYRKMVGRLGHNKTIWAPIDYAGSSGRFCIKG